MYICDISHAPASTSTPFASSCCESIPNFLTLDLLAQVVVACVSKYSFRGFNPSNKVETFSDSGHLLKSLQQTVEDDKSNLLQYYPP